MKNKNRILASSFDYKLPAKCIATRPVSPSSSAKMLVKYLNSSEYVHLKFFNLTKILRKNDLLVINKTRVKNARLKGIKTDTGGKVEGLMVSAEKNGIWAMLKSNSTLKNGTKVTFLNDKYSQDVFIEKKVKNLYFLTALLDEDLDFKLQQVGRVPLPPYIRRVRKDIGWPEESFNDQDWYQTIFSNGPPKSIASPTAGLHFDKLLISNLTNMGVHIVDINLEVGIGTFSSMETTYIDQHQMHEESWEVPLATIEAINRTRKKGGRVIAVGTTTVRALESMKWKHGHVLPEVGEKGKSDLMITPGFEFSNIDGLITNFHLPKSTLLALVSAIVGDEWREIYLTAIKNNYRFYSYGDAMIVLPS